MLWILLLPFAFLLGVSLAKLCDYLDGDSPRTKYPWGGPLV